jgi:hypothetical protein
MGLFKENQMNAPSFRFNYVERTKPNSYFGNFCIVNDEGECFETFSFDDVEKGYKVWLTYLTKEEKAQWDEYVSDCDAAEAVAYEQQCERLHFSFN